MHMQSRDKRTITNLGLMEKGLISSKVRQDMFASEAHSLDTIGLVVTAIVISPASEKGCNLGNQ